LAIFQVLHLTKAFQFSITNYLGSFKYWHSPTSYIYKLPKSDNLFNTIFNFKTAYHFKILTKLCALMKTFTLIVQMIKSSD